jgi:hypothetical protein
LINEEVEADARVKELPQLPQNLAVSRFWLRQVGQINISILQKTSRKHAVNWRTLHGQSMWMKTTHTILSNSDFVNGSGEFVEVVKIADVSLTLEWSLDTGRELIERGWRG